MTGTTTDPQASTDPSANPVYVPGYGWVSWPRALLDAQAKYLSFIHRPNHPPLSRRVRRWLRWRGGAAGEGTDESLCVFCGLEWLCPEAAWARGWLSPMARLRGRCRPRHRARAKAGDLLRRLRRLRGSPAGPGRATGRTARAGRTGPNGLTGPTSPTGPTNPTGPSGKDGRAGKEGRAGRRRGAGATAPAGCQGSRPAGYQAGSSPVAS